MTRMERALKEMRSRGYVCEKVEKWNQYSRIRQDLFGIIDVLCLGKGEILGLQVCDMGSMKAHERKVLDSPNIVPWLEAGGTFVIQGWDKRGKAGKRKLWQCKEWEITLSDCYSRSK